MLIKAKAHIKGRTEAIMEDAMFFLRTLWIDQDKKIILEKLRLIPDYQEDWIEFFSLS